MTVTFHIPAALREFTAGSSTIEIQSPGQTETDALAALWMKYPGVRDRVLNQQDQIRQHINIFVGNENVRYTGGLRDSSSTAISNIYRAGRQRWAWDVVDNPCLYKFQHSAESCRKLFGARNQTQDQISIAGKIVKMSGMHQHRFLPHYATANSSSDPSPAPATPHTIRLRRRGADKILARKLPIEFGQVLFYTLSSCR